MLASKPEGTPLKLAAATTEMMWACAIATARVTVASTARSLELWTLMLRPAGGLPNVETTAAAGSGEAGAAPAPDAAVPPAPPDAAAFASYRSAGGHAAAQVAVSE